MEGYCTYFERPSVATGEAIKPMIIKDMMTTLGSMLKSVVVKVCSRLIKLEDVVSVSDS